MESLKSKPEVNTLKHTLTRLWCLTEDNLHVNHFHLFFAELSVPWATLKSSVKLSIAQQIQQWTEGQNPAGCGRRPFQVFCQEESAM